MYKIEKDPPFKLLKFITLAYHQGVVQHNGKIRTFNNIREQLIEFKERDFYFYFFVVSSIIVIILAYNKLFANVCA